MQTFALLKNARISPQKCRLVADTVRGKPVGQALAILRFMPKKGAELVRKVLESAIANAEHNHGADIDELTVSRIEIDTAATLKRFGAHGLILRPFTILQNMSEPDYLAAIRG